MPANPNAVITLGTFYLLRELEMAAAKVEYIMLVHECLEVKLRLSMSEKRPHCERS